MTTLMFCRAEHNLHFHIFSIKLKKVKVGLDSFFFFGKVCVVISCKILFVDLPCA